MPSAFGNLNGSGPQQIWINNSLVSQDIANNRSLFQGEIRYYGNGYGSWSADPQSWSGNFGGHTVSGTWTITESDRYDEYTVLWRGTYYKNHNADGTLGAFTCTGTINTNHTSIGDGSVSVTQPAVASIPRGPLVRSGGVWRPTVAYVRVGGVWKVATPYVRVGGVWKVAGG